MAGELEHVQKALRDLGKSVKSLSGDPLPKEVHKLRTSARRVEAITGALPPGKKAKRLVKSIEPLRKTAGGVRDMDVLTANVHKLSQSVPADSLSRLVEHLESSRTEEAGELQRELQRERKVLRLNLKQYAEMVQETWPDSDFGNSAAAHSRNDRHRNAENATVKHLARELGEFPVLTGGNIHKFRLKVKELRYILQLDAGADPELVAELGNVQRRIGDWHDWEQLAEMARGFLDSERDRVLLAQIDEIRQQKFSRALATANAMRRQHLPRAFIYIAGC
jgi:CHAD domain-containing protein